jgi:hypothetical protein
MRQRVRPERDLGIAGERAQLVPAEAEVAGQTTDVEPGLVAEPGDDRSQALLRPGAQAPVDRLERCPFLGRGAARKIDGLAVEPDLETVETVDGLLELEPPQAAFAVGEIGRDEQRPGRPVAPQDRQRVLDVVAVAVVEPGRSSRETRSKPLLASNCKVASRNAGVISSSRFGAKSRGCSGRT